MRAGEVRARQIETREVPAREVDAAEVGARERHVAQRLLLRDARLDLATKLLRRVFGFLRLVRRCRALVRGRSSRGRARVVGSGRLAARGLDDLSTRDDG